MSEEDEEQEGVVTHFAPANEAQQLQILQSLPLTKHVPSIEKALDWGLQAATVKTADTTTQQNGKQDEAWKPMVQALLDEYGRNELPKPELPGYFALWIGAFKDIMMVLLMIAMIVLYAVGDPIAATAILIIVLIATNVGAYTEYTSNQAAAELGDLPGTSLVKDQGDNNWVELVNTELLPGMLLQLRTGDIVPADCIILQQKVDACFCTEALLTGESEPVHKYRFYHDTAADDPHAGSKKEAQTRLYMGTEFSGDCIALVVETGERTNMGRIFASMAESSADPPRSPLQIMIDRLIVVLAILSIAASVVNAAVCIPTGRGVEAGNDDPQALTCVLNSVALTVAAVPENLPVALVIALAAIIRNLAARGVIVKSLPAGEELSRLNYVFSDKTGTLTMNTMTARAVVTLHGHAGLSDDFVAPEESTPLSSTEPLTDQIRALAAKAQDEVRSNPTGDACKKAYPEHLSMALERVHLETATSKTKMARAAMTVGGVRQRQAATLLGQGGFRLGAAGSDGTGEFDDQPARLAGGHGPRIGRTGLHECHQYVGQGRLPRYLRGRQAGGIATEGNQGGRSGRVWGRLCVFGMFGHPGSPARGRGRKHSHHSRCRRGGDHDHG